MTNELPFASPANLIREMPLLHDTVISSLGVLPGAPLKAMFAANNEFAVATADSPES
jgi:hypothetical protein